MTYKVGPLVTIAIPTYNRADSYLKPAIVSALSQTYQNVDIVISDNCSSDNTESVVTSFGDPRIRYFRHKVSLGGHNNNFNFCLSEARGDYFLLLCDDDLLDADFVECCMKAAEPYFDTGIIRTGTRVIDASGTVVHSKRNKACKLALEAFFLAWFSHKTSLYLCSTLFHTQRLREIGGFKSKTNLFEDVIAEVKLAAAFGRVDVEDVKASFRKHGSELTFAAKVADWCEDSLFLLEIMSDISGESKEVVREQGERFFAKLNYKRAMAVKAPLKRLLAYTIVFSKFKYNYLPPPVHRFLSRTPLSAVIRGMKA